MNTPMRFVLWGVVCLSVILVPTISASAATFFFTGPSGGDFYDESNWNDLANGLGSSPAAGTIEPTTALAPFGITHDLIIDGDTVSADGGLDGSIRIGDGISLGGLDIRAGSTLDIFNSSFNSQFGTSAGSTFSFVDSVLTADDDIVFRGSDFMSGGTIESFADDVEFRSSDLTVAGTTFNVDDSTIFEAELTPASGASITGAIFNGTGRAGIRDFNVTMTDSTLIYVGDLENVFTTDLDDATGTLTLLGNSSLTADQVQEGVKLVLDGNSSATLTNVDNGTNETTWITEASTRVTLNSITASLVLVNPQTNLSNASDIHIFNGVTGLSYNADPSTWVPTTWNGTDAVTLAITSLPTDPDFDGDGDVDGTDFLTWQRGFGLTGQVGNSNGDANGDGVVDASDLAAWEGKFGTTSGPAVGGAATAVPEPASGVLLLIAAVGGLCCFGRRSTL